ncbi:serine/threonine-protein kinase [Actinomadura sp. GTD37]|uniref:serine/threonine-protein kinase n=1 Tax=Actinomadura sp. GTD37 TaxID=1778030 RepID=UPI0035BF6DA6
MRTGQELAGRYRLEQRLGRGGMGEVWRALDLRLDRRVALKVLLVDWTGEQMDQALARFRREGRAAARLNHPRIATVHDTGASDGRPFLVLELLAGPDLATLLDDHPGGLPIGTVLDHGAKAAEGLAAAHEAGVIHRDVKPSNLMLDGDGTLKICDFGIARLSGATAGLSATGIGFGTVAYMPPEQLLGEPVTGAADVYALGATLFHLLTGRLLFPAEDLRAVMGQVVHKAPPRPSSLRPAVPEALDDYLLTLLAKDPLARPPAAAIPAALRALALRLGTGHPEPAQYDDERVHFIVELSTASSSAIEFLIEHEVPDHARDLFDRIDHYGPPAWSRVAFVLVEYIVAAGRLGTGVRRAEDYLGGLSKTALEDRQREMHLLIAAWIQDGRDGVADALALMEPGAVVEAAQRLFCVAAEGSGFPRTRIDALLDSLESGDRYS